MVCRNLVGKENLPRGNSRGGGFSVGILVKPEDEGAE